MDIVLKRKTKPEINPVVEAVKKIEAVTPLTLFYRSLISALLISLVPMIFPHETVAQKEYIPAAKQMTFEAGNQTTFLDEIQAIAIETDFKQRHLATVEKLKRHLRLEQALANYLRQKRSPLADYADVILQQNNWKKIVALANAESTLCRNYIEENANCWGVGGEDLWDMGSNLGEGVVEMNHFLNTSPKRSHKKYADMLFIEMNGLYKQPAADHWVYNNMVVYNDLVALEKNTQ